ncbi:hypothetical protein FHR71_002475 [Methylobacterium sp. RAS18]|nr:hypothetical protein [Methylobacterium sp. RAS18]
MVKSEIFLAGTIGGFLSAAIFIIYNECILKSKTALHTDADRISRPSLKFGIFLATLIALGCTAIACVGVAAYRVEDTSAQYYGQRGDFFGGILNPALTFITFIGFIYTIYLQKTELQESRVQFKRSADSLAEQSASIRLQNYQGSFFQLLATHNDIVNAISVKDPVDNEIKIGREAFQVIYSSIRRIYRDKSKKFPRAGKERALQYAYGKVYRDYQNQLGHYMRFLYNSIVMLQDGPDATRYIKLVRAQLSNQELLVIYYNCASSEMGLKFKLLAEKYQLFDNMPPHLLDDWHGTLLLDTAFGEGGYKRLQERARMKIRGDLTVLNDPK